MFDTSDANRASLEARGAVWAHSAAEAADGAAVLFTALPAPPQVRSVMEGGGDAEGQGLLDVLPEGSFWVDHSTGDKNEAQRLSEEASRRGITMLEAPLTGGLELLRAGMMTVLAGGERETVEAMRPLMESYANTILHMGPVGAASVVKIVTNMLAATHTVVSGEALMLCKRQGVDLRAAFDGIRASAGNSFVFETEAPLFFSGSFDPGFTLELHCKDLDLGRQLALESETPLELMSLAEQIYRRAMVKYGRAAGSSHPPRLSEDDTGTNLQIEGFDKWCYSIEKVSGGGIGVVHDYESGTGGAGKGSV